MCSRRSTSIYESVKNNKSLKIEAQLAQLEKIEAEKKAFDEGGTLPTLAGMKVALSEYRTAQKKAEDACKPAFEKAAKAYRDKGDVKTAGVDAGGDEGVPGQGPGRRPAAGRPGQHRRPALGQGSRARRRQDRRRHEGRDRRLRQGRPDAVVEGGAGRRGVGVHREREDRDGDDRQRKNNGTDVIIAKKAQPADEHQLWKTTAVPARRTCSSSSPSRAASRSGVDGKSKDAGAASCCGTTRTSAPVVRLLPAK